MMDSPIAVSNYETSLFALDKLVGVRMAADGMSDKGADRFQLPYFSRCKRHLTTRPKQANCAKWLAMITEAASKSQLSVGTWARLMLEQAARATLASASRDPNPATRAIGVS